MAIDTDLHSLVINELTKAKYDELAAQGLINENELYIVTDAETAVKVKEGGALVGDGTSAAPLDISDAFKSQLSGNIEALNKEIEDRIAADELEAQTRQEKDEELQQAINNEAQTRQTKDEEILAELASKADELQGKINSEAQTRQEKDTELTSKISQEISDRKSGDSALQNAIDAEKNARETADSELEELINEKTQALEDSKQDNLTAGTNMEITNNTISTVATQVIRRRW